MGLMRHGAGETILRERAAAGMRCCIYPKKQFGEKFAAVVVPFGSNDVCWQENHSEKPIRFPLGVAHFIEHKLFQQSWGDALFQFGKQGAAANAFTDGEKTVYYFSCRENFMENLRLLLDFVQHPCFQEEDVEKEKSIIRSEIRMGKDDANRAAYETMVDLMYQKHPVRFPVAGTEESVKNTTAEKMQKVYDACYLPQKFWLICAGDVDDHQIMEATALVQEKESTGKIVYCKEPDTIQERYREIAMGLRRPVFQLGFKLEPRERNLQEKLAMELLMDLWAGESSPFFLEAYEKDLLDVPLERMYSCGNGFAFCAFMGSGEQAEETAELLLTHWKRLKQNGIDENHFRRLQKKAVGQTLRLFQSISAIGLTQIELTPFDADLSDLFRLTKELHKKDLEKLLQNTIVQDKMVLSVMR